MSVNWTFVFAFSPLSKAYIKKCKYRTITLADIRLPLAQNKVELQEMRAENNTNREDGQQKV